MEDYVKGSISGIAQAVSGHPFDTIKVLKQNNIKYKFNLYNLYKGLSFPLLTNSVIIGTQFYMYHNHSALLTGFISGLMIAPVDYFKIQKQINPDYKYKLKIPSGLHLTILREGLSMPIYFNSYYWLNEKINNSFLSGGVAGILSWLIPYPIDTIKTRVQCGNNLVDSIKMKNYWKGLPFCLLRAFLVNGTGFYCSEKIKF